MSLTIVRSPTLDSEEIPPSDIEKDDYSNTPLLLSASGAPSFRDGPDTRWKPHHSRILTIIIITLFFTNLVTLIILFTLHISSSCSRVSSSEPPTGVPKLLLQLPRTTTPKLFNATLHDPSNAYRFHSSPVADRAWSELISDTGVLLVQRGDEEAAGIAPDRHVYWDDPKKGLVGYPVLLEAVHQLHCLDMLRKHLWYNVEWTREHYGESEKMMDNVIRELHIDHCVDLLRQRLMCTADTGLLPLVWIGDKGQYVADFVRWHRCRDHAALRSLVREHAVLGPNPGEIMPKTGDFKLKDYE